ncbi:MAG: hypothetical protein ABI855_17905, partial [Bacteroidota bacterium]
MYDSCVGTGNIDIYYGWNCSGFPMGFDTSLCAYDTAHISFIDEVASGHLDQSSPDTIDLCKPFIIAAQLTNAGQGAIYPFQLYLDTLPPNLTITSVLLKSCFLPQDSVIIAGSPPDNITATLLDSIGINEDSIIALGENCLYAYLTVEAGCASAFTEGDTINFPHIHILAESFCHDTTDINARVVSFPPLQFQAIYSGVSHCTNCFTLTKTALQDTVAVGDTATFQIIICGNNADTEIVNLTEYLPMNFDTLPGSVIPATDTLYGQQCDTILVSGTFNTSGSCPDSAFTNTVQISNAFVDTTASACINVIPSVQPCIALADTIIPNGAHSSSYGGGLSGITIYIVDTFFVNNLFSLSNCTVYTAPGAIIIKMGGATLILDSTTINGCTTMWRGIHVYADGSLIEQNNSSIKNAEYGVFAEDRTRIMIMNSGITDCITGLYIPPNLSGMNNVQLTVYGSSFGLYSPSFKPNFSGQTPHDSLPRAGIEVNDEKATIGDYNFAQNSFHNLNTGITGIRSILTVQNSEFGKIKVDSFYPFGFNGTAIADTGKKSDLTVYSVASGNTIHDSYRGIYTDQSNLLALRLQIINVNTGVYSEHCTNSSTSTVYECTIDCKRWGIRWENN